LHVDGHTDGRTNGHDKAHTRFRNFAEVSEKKKGVPAGTRG